MSFASPRWLLALFLVPALVFFLRWAFAARARALAAFVGRLGPRLVLGTTPERRRLKAAGLVLAVLFAVLALAAPRWGFRWEEIPPRGSDIALVVDVSRSMLAEDITPTRLERAKRKIADFLGLLEGDRVALVAFAGRAFVQCPLTQDYAAVQWLLASLDPESVSVGGSAVGRGLEKAVEVFPEASRAAKAIVIFSDGEDHEGETAAVVEQAKARGVKIFAVGIGKETGAPIPLAGGGFRKDGGGNVILTKLEERTLKDAALATGGSYVRTVAGDEDIRQILGDIREAGGGASDPDAKGGRRRRAEERFQWPLALALLLLLVEVGTGEAPPPPRVRPTGRPWWLAWRRRPAAATVAVLLLVSGTALAGDLGDGQKAYQRGDYEAALKHFLAAEVDDPDNAALKYNLGATYYKLKRFDEARLKFEAARAAKDAALGTKSTYNEGNAAFREGKLEDALKRYEEALGKSPADEDAKHNLDVVKRAMELQKQQPQQSKDDGKQDPNKKNQDQKQGEARQGEEKQGKQDPSMADRKAQQAQAQKADAKNDAGKDQKAQQAQAGADKKGDDDKKSASAGDDKKMGKEEAESWLSRLKEGRPKMAGGEAGKRQTQVEKDW